MTIIKKQSFIGGVNRKRLRVRSKYLIQVFIGKRSVYSLTHAQIINRYDIKL